MSALPDMTRTGLILFSHGSLLCGSGSMLQKHAETLRKSGRYAAVETGYLNYCSPSIDSAITLCAEAGVKSIVIVPYFLVSGKFVQEDLPARLASLQTRFSQLTFSIAEPLLDADPLLGAVEELLGTATSPVKWQERAVQRARAACELRRDCPIYGTILCRSGNRQDSVSD